MIKLDLLFLCRKENKNRNMNNNKKNKMKKSKLSSIKTPKTLLSYLDVQSHDSDNNLIISNNVLNNHDVCVQFIAKRHL